MEALWLWGYISWEKHGRQAGRQMSRSDITCCTAVSYAEECYREL